MITVIVFLCGEKLSVRENLCHALQTVYLSLKLSYVFVIFQAERELGVKVDNNVISGLSNTLDKLVSKLQDTETGKIRSRLSRT